MTTLDRLVKERVETMLKDARPDQVKRLLEDIGAKDVLPTPTHSVSERLQ